MLTLTFKPLRKPVHMLHITDEEIRKKLKDKKQSAVHLLKLPKAKYNGLLAKVVGHKVKTMMVNDSHGKIENILLTCPPFYDQKNPDVCVDPSDERHLRTLIKHLSHTKRHYTVVCHAFQVDDIRSWFKELKIKPDHYTLCISVFNYSIWAQDAYVALNDKNGNIILCEGVCFTRDQDMSVADDVASQSEIIRLQSHLYFQGGNILQIGDYIVIGRDYLKENCGRMFLETMDKVLQQFENLLGKPVISLGRKEIIEHKDRQYLGGGIFQPIFHIDMYVTPTGKKGKSGKEVVFVGSPRLARKIIREKEGSHDFDIYFDEAASQLEKYFEVRRLPLLPTQYYSKDQTMPRHYYLSYNNAVVETYTDRGKVRNYVYLPTYTQDVKRFKAETYIVTYYGDEKKYKKLDDAAKKIWEDLGFKVFGMDGLEDLAMSWGSVHCTTKTLLRSSPEPVKENRPKAV